MDDARALHHLGGLAAGGRHSRRQLIRLGLGLGLSLGAVHRVLDAAAQTAVHVPILDRMMTPDEIKAAIAAEGSVSVANWFYKASPRLVTRFEQYVLDRFGVRVGLRYGTDIEPVESYRLTANAAKQGKPSPFDVLAVEENFWAAAMAEQPPLAQAFLPSGLVPNAERVLDSLTRAPTGVDFQASAATQIAYNSARVSFLTDWKDLADPRLKGRLVIPGPGDLTLGYFLIAMSASLSKDYANLDQMKSVVDFVVDNVVPNASAQFSDGDRSQRLYFADQVDVIVDWVLPRIWQQLGRPEARALVASSGQQTLNGCLWIPTGAAHPVLAQIFIDWRLSDDGQLPGSDWNIDKAAWLEYHEGLMGPSYAAAIPDWIAADYYNKYPTLDQIKTLYKPVNWTVYNRDVSSWLSYYAERLAL